MHVKNKKGIFYFYYYFLQTLHTMLSTLIEIKNFVEQNMEFIITLFQYLEWFAGLK